MLNVHWGVVNICARCGYTNYVVYINSFSTCITMCELVIDHFLYRVLTLLLDVSFVYPCLPLYCFHSCHTLTYILLESLRSRTQTSTTRPSPRSLRCSSFGKFNFDVRIQSVEVRCCQGYYRPIELWYLVPYSFWIGNNISTTNP